MKFYLLPLLAAAPTFMSVLASPLESRNVTSVEPEEGRIICIGTVFFCGRYTIKKRHVNEVEAREASAITTVVEARDDGTLEEREAYIMTSN